MHDIPPLHSLVLFRNRPARVLGLSDKLEVELEDGKTQRLRPKDVVLLHPGPLDGLHQLRPQTGDVESAWQLLSGASVTLSDLAELMYGSYSPQTAWAAWQIIAEGFYFQGTPDAVVARSTEEVERERVLREAKVAEERAWSAFLQRTQEGRLAPEDAPYLAEIEGIAYGKPLKSRLMHELGLQETPELAHQLLLRLRVWDDTVNPHPRRLQVATDTPTLELPPLPQEDRVDLTHLPAYAIDDQGSHDPDDALSLHEGRLWVHVADAAALVTPDSPVDIEARGRGATLYLPDRTAAMLPTQAAARLGLGVEELSPALSFAIELAPSGEILHVEVMRSWIRARRVTYDEAEAGIEMPPFNELWSVAQAYRERRRQRGAIALEFPEVAVRYVGGDIVIRPLPRLRSRAMVTEAMLMAGEAAARFAVEHEIPFPFTTQSGPPTTEPPQTLAAMFAYRRKLRRKQMKVTAEPHAGLGLERYAQVTSPLRRYLDLVAHQQLRAFLRGAPLLGPRDIVERVAAADAVSASVRRAERLSNRHWTLAYLARRGDWRGRAAVVERQGQSATVLIPELALEAQVHVRGSTAPDDTVGITLQEVELPVLDVHFRVENGAAR